MFRNHKVLVIGSSGMLGVDLCQELKGCCALAGMDTRSMVNSHRLPEFVKCDITNRNSIVKAIAKIKPEIVIHIAAYTDVDGCELDAKKAYLVNALGTENVALACKSVGAKMVYISTDFVFDGKKKTPYKEDDIANPLSVYGDSKLEGEKAVSNTLSEYFILRTSWLYGKYGKNFVDTILNKARDGKTFKIVNDQVGSPTFTKDLAKAIHALIDKTGIGRKVRDARIYGIYHVSDTGSVSWYEYAKQILKLSGVRARVMPISSKKLNRPAKRPAMSTLNNAKFEKYTGYKMRNWKDALKEYLK